MACYQARQLPFNKVSFTISSPDELSTPQAITYSVPSLATQRREVLVTAENKISDDVEVSLDCGVSVNIKAFAAVGADAFSVKE